MNIGDTGGGGRKEKCAEHFLASSKIVGGSRKRKLWGSEKWGTKEARGATGSSERKGTERVNKPRLPDINTTADLLTKRGRGVGRIKYVRKPWSAQ